ncbi:aminotransferase class V-fold PLP-dependent enzyme [Nocardioides sp. Kera G14]|uniref:aminotransferase class V-fold PLP-dependent enzyme n=1 Tax=Nocardioides sp. Kera G14 TaxID=2884264 RepID=UPI001D12C07A|nr:aminotransferase class V-fold PLP-dependent enzyme [Nocardioides sp. Kera G14]UDY24799.1 aminotransferase class V-fold PLP-dependent enzyme [Nocardioides sp. Kera G14]
MREIPALLPLVGADTQVPVLDGDWVTYANLDGAASTPALQSVADRVADVMPWYASVHRGAGYLSQVSTALYEEARTEIGAFVGAREGDLTIITRNTTDSINLLASVVPGKVLVIDVEHHANFLPWQNHPQGVTIVVGSPTVTATLDRIEAELEGEAYALVAVTGASNVTGESLPLDRVIAVAHEHGARVLVDGAQLLAHRRFSLAESDADYVAFSAHKLYAPYGAGALVGRRDWLDDGPAYLSGGGAVRQVQLRDTSWTDGPARHEGGTPNLVGAVALAAACRAIEALDTKTWHEHETALRDRLVSGLTSIEGVRIARLWVDSDEPVGVVTFTMEDAEPGYVAAYLSAEHGVGVRDGRFCAHPLLARLDLPLGAVRVSVGLGTTSEDVDRLIEGLRAFVNGQIKGDYRLVDGLWHLENDNRPLPEIDGLLALADTAGICAPD